MTTKKINSERLVFIKKWKIVFFVEANNGTASCLIRNKRDVVLKE